MMEYYSALTHEEILTEATTWMNLVDTMLGGICQHKRQILYLYEVCKIVRFTEKERMVATRG
jgi:hypothetical protein